MNNKIILVAGAAALGLATVFFLKSPAPGPAPAAQAAKAPVAGAPIVQVVLPKQLSPQAQIGKIAFDNICAACHGKNAAGRQGMGPPFVHPIYRPGHHGDMAFQMAVKQGVRAHHWPFGNMPPQPGLTPADVQNIVAYVRELQRANGIE